MTLKNFKVCLSVLCLSLGFINQSYSQDGLWGTGTVFYYEPHANDYVTYGGIQRVQMGSDGHFYALIRLDYSYDVTNGPSAQRKRDHAIVGIPYAAWPDAGGPFWPNPYPTISVSSDDGVPVNLKTFGNNLTQYVWLRATGEDTEYVYFNSRFMHVYNVMMSYSNDWLGLIWYITAYNVLIDDFYINDSFSKSNVTS